MAQQLSVNQPTIPILVSLPSISGLQPEYCDKHLLPINPSRAVKQRSQTEFLLHVKLKR